MSGLSFYFKRKIYEGNSGKLIIRADGRTRESFVEDFQAMLKAWEDFETLRKKMNVI